MTILPFSLSLNIGVLAERQLHESPYYFLKRVSCEYNDGILTLRGRVPFARLRECAESIVLRVDRVETIVNQLEVGHLEE